MTLIYDYLPRKTDSLSPMQLHASKIIQVMLYQQKREADASRENTRFTREHNSFARERKYLCERTQRFCEGTQISLRENATFFGERTQISLRENAKVLRGNAKFLEGTQNIGKYFFLLPRFFPTMSLKGLRTLQTFMYKNNVITNIKIKKCKGNAGMTASLHPFRPLSAHISLTVRKCTNRRANQKKVRLAWPCFSKCGWLDRSL